MKNKSFKYVLLLLITLIISLPILAGQEIFLVYPPAISKINAPSTYFIGKTTPGSSLTINDVPVALESGGIFVKTLPLTHGRNSFKLRSTKNNLTAEKKVTVNVPFPAKSLPKYPLQIASNSIKPYGDVLYSTGDIVNVSFKASPGANASFVIGNNIKVPMTELPPRIDTVKQLVLGEVHGMPQNAISGIYNGLYQIKSTDNIQQAPLKIVMSDGKGISKSVLSATKISTFNPDQNPKVAEVIVDNATVRMGPSDSRLTPLPKGVKLQLTGYGDGIYSYRMGPNQVGYIPQNQIKILPQGTPIPFSEVRTVNLKNIYNSTLVYVPLTTKLPFTVDQSVDQTKLSVYLYGAKADTDIIKYDVKDEYLNQVKWSQPFTNVYVLDFLFNKTQQWGYDVYYVGEESKGTLNLIIQLKYPPKVNLEAPLKDKIIALDPGHGGTEQGSVGPGLIPEKQINLEISKRLGKILEQQGAKVIYTRTTDCDVELYDRPQIAAGQHADILISMHNNAIPDGRDPLKVHGSSSYYYHPMAFQLAKSIQLQLLKQLNLPNFGLYYDNLVITREYRMPSVLIEVAFMINPGEYTKLNDPKFQQKSAETIANGIKDFFVKTR